MIRSFVLMVIVASSAGSPRMLNTSSSFNPVDAVKSTKFGMVNTLSFCPGRGSGVLSLIYSNVEPGEWY